MAGAPRKLSMKQRYSALTRDLDWDLSDVDPKQAFPYTEFEGIKIHDWSKWEDPFRLTIDAYMKYQAEKDKRLYAVLDSFAQGQGHLQLTDPRYLNAMKLFLQGVTPLEYQAHRNFAFLSRFLNGPGPRFAALCQAQDELRHAQTEIHTLSNYNKFYGGFHNWHWQHDRVWYLSVPKSYFDDAVSAGPFEFLIAIGFSFEYLLTNLLFVPFMSGASFNGDLPTMTFGLYFEQQMLGGLFPDLAYYGIKPPRHVDHAIAEKEILSHQVYWTLYQFSFAAAFNTSIPDDDHLQWLSEQYPDTFEAYYKPLWDKARRMVDGGGRHFGRTLPQLCQVCQIPMLFTEPGDPTTICERHSEFRGERFDFCSDGCKWIFDREPEKYVQAWLPVHQIYQGLCGGPTVPDVLAWYGLQPGDNGEYRGSIEEQDWHDWHSDRPSPTPPATPVAGN
jgi:phenol hydroxylase P3 protein